MFNNYRKFGKFDIGSDIQNTTFSEKLDKNNWTRRIGLSHPGGAFNFFLFFGCKAISIGNLVIPLPKVYCVSKRWMEEDSMCDCFILFCCCY